MRLSDRVILGTICGLSANIVKTGVMALARRLGWADIDGPEKAAGMLIPPHFLAQRAGRVVGVIADNAIGALLGIRTHRLRGRGRVPGHQTRG